MRILGISAFHRDAAAVVLVDGMPVAACREESYTGQPGDAAFPRRAIHACLDQAGVPARDLDFVVFYEKPLRKFERVLVSQLQAFPASARSFAGAMLGWLGDRLWVKNRILKELACDADRVLFTEQHVALAASAFYSSPFKQAALLTIDDAGEWATTTLGVGGGGDAPVRLLRQIDFPHSLGLFASAITQFLGFTPGREEPLLEALAAYGSPTYADRLGQLFAVQDDGFRIDQSVFRFGFDADRLWGDGLGDVLGEPRFSGDPLCIDGDDRRHADIAASVQQILEERVLDLAAQLHGLVGGDQLCLAGSLAGNRRLVTRLSTSGPFARLHVPAAADKAAGALGAALYVHHAVARGERQNLPPSADFGPAIDDDDLPGGRRLADGAAAVTELARRLAAGELVGWARGRLQFVDCGHTNRCVLAMPVAHGRRALLDAMQRSEHFAPCTLLMPAERAVDYLELPAPADAVLHDANLRWPVREELRRAAPSAVDPDGTVWIRLVGKAGDPELHGLLAAVGATTGVPLLLCADFCRRGSVVVRSAFDAVQSFQRSRLDALLVGTQLLIQSDRRRAT